jgi:hypothetical protein
MLNDCTIRTEERICSTSEEVWPSRLLAGPPTMSLAQPRTVKMMTTKGTMEKRTPASLGELAKLETMA